MIWPDAYSDISKLKIQKQSPSPVIWEGLVYKGLGDDLLSHGRSALSSALRRFTVLFGMGRGGANALWSPGILELGEGSVFIGHWAVHCIVAVGVIGSVFTGMTRTDARCIGSKVIESSRTGN